MFVISVISVMFESPVIFFDFFDFCVFCTCFTISVIFCAVCDFLCFL